MKSIISTIAGLAAYLFLIFHIAMTAVYLMPNNLIKNRINGFLYGYMEPLFYQNWHLFSPNPGISWTKLLVNCGSDDGQISRTIEPFATIQSNHNRNRMSGRGKLLYVYRNIGDKLFELHQDALQECRHLNRDKVSNSEIFLKDVNSCAKNKRIEFAHSSPMYQKFEPHAKMLCAKHKDGQDKNLTLKGLTITQLHPTKYSKSTVKKDQNVTATLQIPLKSISEK
jgi:hypothetical protein